MNKDQNISEEQLNAFVDNELEAEERNWVFDAAEESAELDQRLCQQRKLKELVQHAYRDVPEPKRNLTVSRSRFGLVGLSIAASIMLLMGAGAGLYLHGVLDRNTSPTASGLATDVQAAAVTENYILHVMSGDQEMMKLALQKADTLLSSAEPGHQRQVEIVANDKGLNLLRSDTTLFSDEISALANRNVIFYACSKAIQRLEEKGVEVQLVPEAIAGYTALDRVVVRMKDGWQYIKI